MKPALVVLLLGVAGLASAQPGALVDPTRPPNAGGEATARATAPSRGPQLQSVLISPSRRVAVISGETVAQGEKYGNATVVAITEASVLLRYADRKETLHLIPGVAKRVRRTGDAAQSEEGSSK